MTAAMRAIAFLTAGLVAACGSSGPGASNERIRRDKDAGDAVAIVDRPGSVAVDRPAEKEPNDDPATAMKLEGGVRGALDGELDVDAFALTVTAPGMVAVKVTGVADVDLKLELRDARFALVVAADKGPAGAAESLPNAPVDKGIYHLVVREIPKKRKKPKKGEDAAVGRVGPSAIYELTATMLPKPEGNAEREPNDDEGTSNDLALGEPATGWIGWGGDKDTWKLEIEALAEGNGLDLSLTAVEGTALTMEVTDAGGRPVMKTSGKAGEALSIGSLVPRVAPGGAAVHHIRVSGKPANPDDPYTLTVATRLLDLDEEAEPNDRTSQSNALRFGVEDQGAMRGKVAPGDTDIFALSASPTGMALDVALDAPPGMDVALSAIAESGASLGKADRGGPGVAERLAVDVPAGTLVYLQLTTKPDKTARAAAPYQLRWSLTEGSATAPPTSPPDDPLPPEE
jgi:hypothetical protein